MSYYPNEEVFEKYKADYKKGYSDGYFHGLRDYNKKTTNQKLWIYPHAYKKAYKLGYTNAIRETKQRKGVNQ